MIGEYSWLHTFNSISGWFFCGIFPGRSLSIFHLSNLRSIVSRLKWGIVTFPRQWKVKLTASHSTFWNADSEISHGAWGYHSSLLITMFCLGDKFSATWQPGRRGFTYITQNFNDTTPEWILSYPAKMPLLFGVVPKKSILSPWVLLYSALPTWLPRARWNMNIWTICV